MQCSSRRWYKSEEYSEHSKISPAYWFSPPWPLLSVYHLTVLSVLLHFGCCCCCSYSFLHPGNPSPILTGILEGLSQENRAQQNTVKSSFTKNLTSIQRLYLFSLRCSLTHTSRNLNYWSSAVLTSTGFPLRPLSKLKFKRKSFHLFDKYNTFSITDDIRRCDCFGKTLTCLFSLGELAAERKFLANHRNSK